MICRFCGSEDIQETIFTDENRKAQHYGERKCNSCGVHLGFIKSPKNEGKRSDKNTKWTNMWRDKGELFCAMCGVRESDFKNQGFECDHIKQLEAGGEDAFENTMMLCKSCHVEKTGMWARTKQWRLQIAKRYESGEIDTATASELAQRCNRLQKGWEG